MSYKINSRSGDEEELKNMVKTCNDLGLYLNFLKNNFLENIIEYFKGVRVYVDVVLNHMATGDGEAVGTAGSTANPQELLYPQVPYLPGDFNEQCEIQNNYDALQVRNCRLSGLPDLNQSLGNVRNKIVEYLNKLISFGAAGFRVDACKVAFLISLIFFQTFNVWLLIPRTCGQKI